MGRLFWKFFFAFWCALLTAGVGVWLGMTLYDRANQPSENTLATGPRALFMVDTAAGLAAREEFTALKNLLEQWQHFTPALEPVYVVDPQGKELFDRPLPIELLRKARELAPLRSPGDIPFEPWLAAARDVVTTTGEPYLVFALVGDSLPLNIPLASSDSPPSGPPGSPMGSPLSHPPRGLPLAAGLLASLVFSALLAWHFAKPVRLLRWALGAVAAGNLDTRVRPLMGDRRDEIADLSRDFDRMTEELQHHIAAQRRLLHDVSHELRSPLARLQAAIGLARQNPAKMTATLDRIEREGQRLDILVGEILTLARLEAGPTQGTAESLDLAELLADVVADVRFEAQTAQKTLVFGEIASCPMQGHLELLHRAMENILRNALAYTPLHGVVEVILECTASKDSGERGDPPCQARVVVCDRGPGVPPEELEEIFSPFYRIRKKLPTGHPPPASGSNGFGLGLAIARRAVEAHGGMVRAFNREGGGLCVEVQLPLAGCA